METRTTSKAAVVKSQMAAMTELTSQERRAAEKAIGAMREEYYKRGGLRDSYERTKMQAESISTHIYRLAQTATRSTSNLEQAARRFSYLCAHAEAKYKETYGISNLRDLDKGLPPWPVFKSNILRGMRLGLSPLEYRSEHTFRDATMEHVRAEIGLNPTPALEPHPDVIDTTQELESLLIRTGLDEQLRGAAAEALSTLKRVSPSKASEAATILKRAIDRIANLARRRG